MGMFVVNSHKLFNALMVFVLAGMLVISQGVFADDDSADGGGEDVDVCHTLNH
jgi:hypothetical protein